MMDYRVKAQEAIDGAYGVAIERLFDAELAHMTAKQESPETAVTMQKIVAIHQKMTKIVGALSIPIETQ